MSRVVRWHLNFFVGVVHQVKLAYTLFLVILFTLLRKRQRDLWTGKGWQSLTLLNSDLHVCF